jgi:alcohol dehydrogenase
MGNRYISLQKNGTSAGGFDPAKDIPRYCEMFRHGTFDGYEKIITHRISLDQINEGIQLMRDGKAGRVMIEM